MVKAKLFPIVWTKFDSKHVKSSNSGGDRKFSQGRPSQMNHYILIALTLYMNAYDFIYGKQQNLLLKRFTYIFLLTYTLNASKINNLYSYMIKKSILKRK